MFSTEVNGSVVTYNDIDDPFFIEAYPSIKKHSLTANQGPVALWVLYKSIEYIVKNGIPGDIAECGVWNGGSMLLAALALKHFGDTSRKLYLYDTFAACRNRKRSTSGTMGSAPCRLGRSLNSKAAAGASAARSKWCKR